MTDPIADMLTRIRNAVHARHARVELPASKLKVEIAKILQDEGYIAGYKLVEAASDACFDDRFTRCVELDPRADAHDGDIHFVSRNEPFVGGSGFGRGGEHSR